jgi:hypothetical protein
MLDGGRLPCWGLYGINDNQTLKSLGRRTRGRGGSAGAPRVPGGAPVRTHLLSRHGEGWCLQEVYRAKVKDEERPKDHENHITKIKTKQPSDNTKGMLHCSIRNGGRGSMI